MGPLRKPVINRARPTKITRRPVRGQLALALGSRERLATRRRRVRVILSLIGLLVAAGSVWGLGVLSYHERLAIADVSVAGTQALPPDAIKTAFDTNLNDGKWHLFSRTNIFLYPRTMLRTALMQEFPRLESVSVSRESLLAQAVQVTVQERVAAYQWCKGSNCYLMDKGGFIFAAADGTGTAYTFRGGLVPTEEPLGQTFLRGRLTEVVGLFRKLEEAGFSPREAVVENETDMQIVLGEGYFLKVTFGAEADKLAKDLTLITSSDALQNRAGELEYVDLRFGNRVYYQLK